MAWLSKLDLIIFLCLVLIYAKLQKAQKNYILIDSKKSQCWEKEVGTRHTNFFEI